MPLADFLRRYDEQPFELIDGEMIPLSAKVFGSDYVAWTLQNALTQIGSGYVFIETTFILPDTPEANWVKGSRQPDVLYLAKERLDVYRRETADWRLKPLTLVPDVAVEIVSPTDRLPKVWRKAAVYLEDGVRLVWVINPMREAVTIYASDEPPITLHRDGLLNGGAVLPGFSMAVHKLFEG